MVYFPLWKKLEKYYSQAVLVQTLHTHTLVLMYLLLHNYRITLIRIVKMLSKLVQHLLVTCALNLQSQPAHCV